MPRKGDTRYHTISVVRGDKTLDGIKRLGEILRTDFDYASVYVMTGRNQNRYTRRTGPYPMGRILDLIAAEVEGEKVGIDEDGKYWIQIPDPDTFNVMLEEDGRKGEREQIR